MSNSIPKNKADRAEKNRRCDPTRSKNRKHRSIELRMLRRSRRWN
ncbi:MAG: hypothetical protein U0103_24400 [Candidatus Obscuribacterales bacterium]